MLTDVYIFYIFVYTYTCNDMRSVMLQINEYDDDDDDGSSSDRAVVTQQLSGCSRH